MVFKEDDATRDGNADVGRDGPMIESNIFLSDIKKQETTLKILIFVLLVWSILSGNRNLDFLWSYLSVMQIASHLALLKIQFPQNAMQMSKSMASVSLLDIKEVQNAIFSKESILNVGVHVSNLLELIELPGEKTRTKNIEEEITQY